ncbi:MAG: hypothetical protein MI923_08420 [Phycisphaerales bacterium]|nr:hypothetical protein [Phycisphaerales bacterium]
MKAAEQDNGRDLADSFFFVVEKTGVPEDEKETLHLDRFEYSILQIVQLMCQNYVQPTSHAWEKALAQSAAMFGTVGGGAVAIAVLNMLSALRKSRRTSFQFTDPFCACCRTSISECEMRLLNIINGKRTGQTQKIHMNSVILCEGFPAEDFLEKIDTLIATFESFALMAARLSDDASPCTTCPNNPAHTDMS